MNDACTSSMAWGSPCCELQAGPTGNCMDTLIFSSKHGNKVMISSRPLIKESGERTQRNRGERSKQARTGPS